MRALLDTNCFLWFIAGNDRLSVNAQNFILDLNNELVLSPVSLWEMAIKVSIGKLELLKSFEELIPAQLQMNAVDLLPIEVRHLSMLIRLPFHHRDPFDRLIISQGIVEEIPVITGDTIFQKYEVEVIT